MQDDSIDEDEETITLTGSATGYAAGSLSIALEDDDTAGIVVSAASLNVNEGATGQFQVKLNSEPLNNVTVSITETSDESEAMSVSDTSLTFTSSNWNTYRTVTVTGVVDAGDFKDADGTITVSAASSDEKYNTTSLNRTVDVDVTNIHEAQITLTSSEASVSEASGSRTATITATVPATAEPGSDLTIALAHSGTAGHGNTADYTVGTLTIAANQRSGTATLTVRDDRVDEGSSETITLTGSATGYTESAALSIPLNDDDTAGVVVSPTSLDITEGDDGTYRVKLNSRPTHSVTVGFSVSGSSTVTVPTSSLTFTTSNWNANKTVTVRTAEDNSDYDDESATITNSATSSDPKYNTNSLDRTVDVDVDDNDSPLLTLSCPSSVSEPSGSGTITVSRPSGYTPNASTTVTLTASGVAIKGTDYTVASSLTIGANQMTSGGESLSVTDDRIDEGSSESITLTASATGYGSDTCTITLNDNDTAGLVVSTSSLSLTEGNDGTYQVKLDSEPTHDVTVSFWMSLDSSSTVSVSTGSLTFTGGNNGTWNTYQTVTVETAEDNSDYNDERATINNFPASSDTKYNSSLVEDVRVSVADDDTPPLTLSCPSSVSEPSGSGTIRVSRPSGYRPSGSTGVSLRASGSATKGTDYRLGSMSLSIPGGQGSDSTTLTVIDDRIDENAKSIRLTASATGYVSGSCSITLNDDDTAGLTLSPASLTITENMSGEYSVNLNSEPTSGVTVSTSTDNADAERSPESRQFTASNWSQAQGIEVSIADDEDYDDETANITNSPSSSDAKYNTTSLNKTVVVNIIDDDLPPLTLSCPSSVSEPSGTGTISVSVPSANAPGSDATVTLSRVSASSTASTSDYTVGALKIEKNKTSGSATLSVTDDKIDEGASESLTLQASASGYGSDTCTITLNDNDTRGVTIDPTSLTVDEGGTATYSVELKTQPVGGSVTVSHSESSTKISVSPASLTFTSDNWSSSQSFTVSGEEDSGHANESATITHSASGGDYGSVTVPDVSVTVDDDEVGPPGINSIRPPLQPPDTEVTIDGSNFGSSEGSVSFGSDSVTDISSWSNTSIVCFIPAFASSGTVSVTVTTSGNQTSSGYSYTITGQSPFRGECGDGEDCPGEEEPKKGGSGGGGSEESEDPPGDGG